MNLSDFPLPAARSLAFCLVVLSCLGLPVPGHTQSDTAEATGLQIARDSRAGEEGFGNLTARQNHGSCATSTGRKARRQLRVKVLEVPEDGDKSLFVFDEPLDVQGTALLVHAKREGADDQWLYLPALNRVKRISSSNRSGSFMGSEFAYEDMTAQEVEKIHLPVSAR